MKVVLISTYDLGRQPFGLASPAAWLRERGVEVRCLDLAVDALDESACAEADLVAFHLPMHTATRLAARHIVRLREQDPRRRLCCYGLYAGLNEHFLRRLGVEFVLSGEFEAGLANVVERLREPDRVTPIAPVVSHERLAFRTPDRRDLPAPSRYARLRREDGGLSLVGSTEASRGCKHHCRHCPVVPIYQGKFRIVSREVVLEDVRCQIERGIEHVTFGDPDFWNAIGHAIPIVEALHAEHPDLTYDVTIKIEHLLAHRAHLATLRRTGCRFVTSAVESIDDRVLERLDKRHTRADFFEALRLCRENRLVLSPTFLPFTPWTTIDGYRELLEAIVRLDLVEAVAPIQLAIRLLIFARSGLLELPEIREIAEPFDEVLLVHPWTHSVPEVDRLQREIEARVRDSADRGESRTEAFAAVWDAARRAGEPLGRELPAGVREEARAPVPYLTEPWYC